LFFAARLACAVFSFFAGSVAFSAVFRRFFARIAAELLQVLFLKLQKYKENACIPPLWRV